MSKSPASPFSSWTLVVALVGLSVLFLWPTWASLNEFWLMSTRYSHGHLIAIISAYLIFVQRDELSRIPARPCIAAFLPLAVLLAVWLVAVLASVQAIHQIVLPAILWLVLLAVTGWAIARRLWAQVAYLYLAIPIWESGNPVLQWLTTQVVALALWLLQVPAYVVGNVVNLPVGAFEVEARCSGLHYFIVAIALSVLYGLLYLKSKRARLVIIAAAIAMALVTNWLRVFLVVYAGFLTDMQHYLVTHDHYYFGWMLFAVILIPYLMFARRLEKSEDNGNLAGDPNLESDFSTLERWPIVAFCVCLFGFMVSSGIVYANIPIEVQHGVQVSLPSVKGRWAYSDSAGSDWRPHYVGASAEALNSYGTGQGVVDAYKNLYVGQVQGEELVGYHNKFEGSSKWSVESQIVRNVRLADPTSYQTVREILLIAASGEKRILYLWYDVGGRNTVSDLEAKIFYGINVLRGRRDAGVRILSVACGQNCDDAKVLLRDWLSDHVLPNGDI